MGCGMRRQGRTSLPEAGPRNHGMPCHAILDILLLLLPEKDDSLVPESLHILLLARSSNQRSNLPASDEVPAPTGVAVVELLLPLLGEAVEEERTFFLH